MKSYSTREFKALVLRNGFTLDRCKGDHFIYKRNNDTIVINNNINMMVTRRLIKENCLVLVR